MREKVIETADETADEKVDEKVEVEAPIVETMVVREPICPSTPILYKENDNESEVSKSSIESNADKKPEKLATRKPLRKLRKPKS